MKNLQHEDTKGDKKIRHSHAILILFCIALMSIVPVVTAGTPSTGHPYMLFHDISETPGYQYRTTLPWSYYEGSVISNADNSLSRNFSGNLGSYDRIMYRAAFARDLGLAYQITKKPQYAAKAKEALLNLSVGSIGAKVDKANALGYYSLAYDFIQPTLDPATDSVIRDKLATLADTVYKDLNDSGSTTTYVTFSDYHGQAYPMVGVAAAALYDYTNPNHLPLSSTPADWHKAGTDYLFVSDPLHSYGRSVFSFGFDEASGKYLNGGYKAYVIEDLGLWFQVSAHAFGDNLLNRYPAAKKAVTSEEWESLPNDFAGNYVTNGNTGWAYQKTIVSLLPDAEKGPVLNHIDRIEKSTLLPFTSIYGASPNALLYCVYGNYAAIPRTFPANTSYFNPSGIYQVFRGSWANDADWLSLVTFNVDSRSNRDMMHNDQLGIEYYSRGNLLLADAGEVKYVLDTPYGYYDIDHNTIAIEDPRTPFPVSPWSGSASAGIAKGGAGSGITTPVTINAMVQVPWMQLMKATAPITTVMTKSFGTTQALSSTIQYERTILYPDSDYFIVVDRTEGSQPWVIRNIFRPTSLMVTPTVDANKDHVYVDAEIGHVNGTLALGSTPYNWQALPYKTETKTGITANSLSWATTSPYGKAVTLNLVSAPSSEILIEKNVGRIGGYEAASEVYNPVVYFRSEPATNQYRVTALLSSYSTDAPKTATEIPVTGTGHALLVHSASSDDYIYTGKGTSSFAGFSTDADTAYIRREGRNVEITLLEGSFIDFQGSHMIDLPKKSGIFTVIKTADAVRYRISDPEEVRGSIFENSTYSRDDSGKDLYVNRIQELPFVYGESNPVISSAETSVSDWTRTIIQSITSIRKFFANHIFPVK